MTTSSSQKVMLHLGMGSFHRAHQACYLQALSDSGDTSRSIALGTLRPDMAETIAALRSQDVAMDGYSKIPGFIAPTIRERLARNESIANVSVLPVLFLAFLQRWHSGEVSLAYQDQVMNSDMAYAICDALDPVAAFAADTVLWGELASDPRLIQALRIAYDRVNQLLKEVPHV